MLVAGSKLGPGGAASSERKAELNRSITTTTNHTANQPINTVANSIATRVSSSSGVDMASCGRATRRGNDDQPGDEWPQIALGKLIYNLG